LDCIIVSLMVSESAVTQVFLRFRSYQGLLRWRIQVLAGEVVSLMVFESATTQLLMTISELTGTVCVDKSRVRLWKQARLCFLSRHRLSFHQWFWSQQGIYRPSNPGISCGVSLIDYFWVISHLIFYDDYRVNRECVRRRNQALGGEHFSEIKLTILANQGIVETENKDSSGK
jgi:hypothetical protein